MQKVKARIYWCTACGAEKIISTNHKGSYFDYCPHCSWKAHYAPSYHIPQHNHGRKFDYLREIPEENRGDPLRKLAELMKEGKETFTPINWEC